MHFSTIFLEICCLLGFASLRSYNLFCLFYANLRTFSGVFLISNPAIFGCFCSCLPKKGVQCSFLHIWFTIFTIRCNEFQLVSSTNHLAVFFLQLGFKIFPVVAGFGIIVLVGKQCNNIQYRKPPLEVFFVPNSTYFSVVKKTNGYFFLTYIFIVLVLSLPTSTVSTFLISFIG
jgi:hypothetical protein